MAKVNAPWVPPAYELADVSAIQGLAGGTANADQQQRALKWIIEACAATYDFHYYPSERDTAFSLGKQFVGQQIVKLTKLRIDQLRKKQPNA